MSDIKEQYYEIYISGKQLKEAHLSMIEEVVLEDNATGADLLHISISDPDFVYIEDSFFVEEAPVHFKGGWKGQYVTFDGFVSVIDLDFPTEGYPSLVIHCMDNSHLMNRKKKKRTWKDTKMSDVAKAIFREHGLTPVVDDTGAKEETISQSNSTDIAFLIDKAKAQDDDFICYVEGKKGYFVKRKVLAKPQATLDYRSGNGKLNSFRPRINKESKQEEINKDNVNANTGKTDKDQAKNTDKRDLQGTPTESSEKRKYTGNGNWEKV